MDKILLGGVCLDDLKEIPYPYNKYLKIGKDVYIKTGTILCGEGFHFTRKDKVLYFNPHTKGLVIRDNVWIGSNCTIDRGRFRPTIIDKGTKIDNGVHISHNCRIGRNCIIGTGAIILGSVEIGDETEIWSRAVIHQGVKVGKGCAVGANTYLRHDLEDGMCAYGDTIKPMNDTKKYGKKEEGGVSRKSCLDGKCAVFTDW